MEAQGSRGENPEFGSQPPACFPFCKLRVPLSPTEQPLGSWRPLKKAEVKGLRAAGSVNSRTAGVLTTAKGSQRPGDRRPQAPHTQSKTQREGSLQAWRIPFLNAKPPPKIKKANEPISLFLLPGGFCPPSRTRRQLLGARRQAPGAGWAPAPAGNRPRARESPQGDVKAPGGHQPAGKCGGSGHKAGKTYRCGTLPGPG